MERSSLPTRSIGWPAFSSRRRLKRGRPSSFLGDPLAGEAAVLDVGEDLLHVFLDALVDDDRAARVVAVFGGVADGVAHVLETALVEQVNYQLELVHALEVGGLGLVSGLDERLEGALDQLRDAAAEDGLLAEQVGLGLFLEGGFQNSGARATDAPGVGETEGLGLAGNVLVDGQQSGDAGSRA